MFANAIHTRSVSMDRPGDQADVWILGRAQLHALACEKQRNAALMYSRGVPKGTQHRFGHISCVPLQP
ncbi:unnamed protein product [Toxocara canis]|uniref:DUF1330 domain-containing protein n=1 Tax=Toxocara canis TaxID=6265 RepID=A0A183UPM6_TOXCA|nr:unnamed protein product [Toxocara canis]